MIKNEFVLTSVLVLSLGLAGCDSGGSSDKKDNKSEDQTADAVVSGAAAKGIVKAGIVTAEELNAAGDVIATIGNAITDADGTYSLTLEGNYTGGPIQISITADSNTQTKCDVPAGCGGSIVFGDFYTPSALTMVALLPDAQSGETLSVSITPFTHMAAARARAAATLDATAIANANSEVSNLLGGIDILNTPPIDITDSSAVDGAVSAVQVTYAALASALSNQGFVQPSGQPDLNAAIELLASSFVSGVIEADDVDGDDGAQISLQEIVSAAEETFEQAGIDDLTGKIIGLQSAINFAEAGDGTIDPQPSSTAADSDLAQVKAMVSDVRTWATVISNEVSASGSTFDHQVGLAAEVVSIFGTGNFENTLAAAIEVALAYDGVRTDLADYTGLGDFVFDSGTIGSTTAGEITLSNGVINGYTVNMSVLLPEDGMTASTFEFGIGSATIDSVQNTVSINSGAIGITFNEDYTIDYESASALPDEANFDFDLDIAYTQNVDSTGVALVSPVTFAGALSFNLDVAVSAYDSTVVFVLPTTFNLSGEISNTLGEKLDASLVVNFSDTDVGDFDAPRSISLSAVTPYKMSSLAVASPTVADTTLESLIEAEIGLSFLVQLDDLPEASININANRTEFDAGNGEITISYGNRQLSLSASVTSSEFDGVLTITNQDGVVLELSLAADGGSLLSGELSRNAINYGSLQETESGFLKITYTDGTFEIF